MNYTRGENRRGNWKGGRVFNNAGYVYVRKEGHPRATGKGHYVFEHILIMEKHVNRFISKTEVVHHINGIKSDNRIENLELTNQSEHMKHHPPKNPFKKGVSHSEEHNIKVSIAKKNWWIKRKKELPREQWSNKCFSN